MNYLQNLPVGKALIPVEVGEYDCDNCFFNDDCEEPHCMADRRIDGKDVIYKLVDVETFNFKEIEAC
jgi:hypothetical protein